MYRETDEAPIHSDAYIEALLDGHARLPITLRPLRHTPATGVRHVIRLLEQGLPRFHPSFLFEDRLAGQLRAAAEAMGSDTHEAALVLDRRLLMGGAIASGFSIAGAAMVAWWRRPRPPLRRH